MVHEPPFDVPYSTGRYRRVFIGQVLIVRWYGTAEPGDFTNLMNECRRYVAQTGSKVVHLAIQSPTHPPLSAEVQIEAARVLRAAFKYCESIHNVVESQGFAASIIRSVVLAVWMAAGLRGKLFFYTSLDRAFDDVALRVPSTKTELVARAREVGLA
ncbi:MAG TPA: hypothetical protein VFS43_35740 [Polyangiaceae bacterium]|nr:hypothetical protein [Polyangiaceae bacterium]